MKAKAVALIAAAAATSMLRTRGRISLLFRNFLLPRRDGGGSRGARREHRHKKTRGAVAPGSSALSRPSFVGWRVDAIHSQLGEAIEIGTPELLDRDAQ